MKFKCLGKNFTAYGYQFFTGQKTDVEEPHLIHKFSKYEQLEEVRPGPKKKVKANDKSRPDKESSTETS